MHHADDIKEASLLGVDLLGFDFIPQSKRYVRMISSQAGIIPDFSEERLRTLSKHNNNLQPHSRRISRVGAFADDMPQNIVTRVYNYDLNYVQLNGDEPAVTLENLRRTIDPDIQKSIRLIKKINISSIADLAKTTGDKNSPLNQLFSVYSGITPFLISKPNAPFDTLLIKDIAHPLFAGIDLDTQFELENGRKDMVALKSYVEAIRAFR